MEFLDYLISRGKSITEAQLKRWKTSVSKETSFYHFAQDFVATTGRSPDHRRAYRIFVVNSGSGLIYSHVIVLSNRKKYGGDYLVIGSWTIMWPTVDVSVAPDGTLSVEGRATGFGKEVREHVLRVNLNQLAF